MANFFFFFFHFILKDILKEIKKIDNSKAFRRAIFRLKKIKEMMILVHD